MITPVPGKPNLILGAYDPSSLGYRADEYFITGTAASYDPVAQADYVTRIVALTPERFNGTVLVEWLNVSGGIDAPAVWLMAHREIARSGFGYVAVSAQRVGVEGGNNLMGISMSLKDMDPQRYSALSHPGDAFAFDIFTQVGRLVRDGGIAGLDAVEHVVAVGESQSAMYLSTYVNDVDPGAAVFDGFLVHSRFGIAAPLNGARPLDAPSPAPFRDDLRVPVLTVLTETDVLDGHLPGYHQARRPDSDRLRVWEIPGTAHADNYTIRVGFVDDGTASVDVLAAAFAPTDELMGQKLSYFINFAPQHHYVLQAALTGLHTWVASGEPAPQAEPLALTGDGPPVLLTDENGQARGGVRTPWVDVPTAWTSGSAPDECPMSFLFGSGKPFDAATLARLYPGGRAEYLDRFTTSLDAAIGAGFVPAADRAEVLELAQATFPG